MDNNPPKCILCFTYMTPVFIEVKKIGERIGHKVLSGYKCEQCREILSSGISPELTCVDIADIEYRIKIIKRYQELMGQKTPLPGGTSFP